MQIRSSLKPLLITAFIITLLTQINPAISSDAFSDVPEDPLYSPYINTLYQKHFITGDTSFGVPTGLFRPEDPINRAEFTKITVFTRLAELYGISENWDNMSELEMAESINDKLHYFYKCDNTDTLSCSSTYGADIYNICNVCESIGGMPFTDVAEKEWGCEEEGLCDPWYTQYIYYAVRKGFIKGYDNGSTRSFQPDEDILRIHALKMIMVDDGEITPENDPRFQRLTALAEARNSNYPKCLAGAEDYILENNGNDTKLLEYALLADRLDLFGNECQVFDEFGATTPESRANLLQNSTTRKEAARYYSLTTFYESITTDPEDDETVNTSDENEDTIAEFDYQLSEPQIDADYDSSDTDTIVINGEVYYRIIMEDGRVITSPVPSADDSSQEEEQEYEEVYIDDPFNFVSLVDKEVCMNSIKSPIICREASANNCISIPDGTIVEVLEEDVYGKTPVGYYTSLWAKVSYAGLTRYVPQDDIDVECEVDVINDQNDPKETEINNQMTENEIITDSYLVTMNGYDYFRIIMPKKYTDAAKEIKKTIIKSLSDAKSSPKNEPEENIEGRVFKTSIEDINIRTNPDTKGDIVKVIPAPKTEIVVIDKAVSGEYVDVYKTDQWYPVRCDECEDEKGNEINQGYILATLLHPDFIEFQSKGMGCNSRYQIKDKAIDRVVLHGTAGSSLSSALNAFNKNSCVGAHFYLGRDGKIVQISTVDKLIWHAGYGGHRGRSELSSNSYKNSYTSIGVEIANIGLYKDQNDNGKKDIDTVFPDHWNMWKEGLHWGGFQNNIDSKKWQFYTEDQYKSLDKLISYIEESTGIPYKVSLYKSEEDKDNDIAYYYHPKSPSDTRDPTKSFEENKQAYANQIPIINKYLEHILSFRGIVDHHTHAGKWDVGPAFDICNKNLNFRNINDFCNK
ncbi:S-layer homology domain-containing protein [Patescibacteria group bacterium]|nr:S-layer homology domain-containing protein [Patescibacteria group bacterium]MBU1935346.1 S-layer homology domain-containing protein [Patescibacteria group bacterium]